MLSKTNYKGRFAPSPTGPLHFGSAVAAVGSYLQARSQCGTWLVRIEDLDPIREVPGATASILRTLEKLGLYWDGEVIYQNQRTEAYLAMLDWLRRDGMLYPCGCTRKEIAERGHRGRYGPIYNGHCRPGLSHNKKPRALRILTHNSPIVFEDAIRGTFSQRLESEFGDFVVRRADDLFAYQLAVVVDDAGQGITEVVRGSDLLDNTPRQIHLQQLLQLGTPRYVHLPVALNALGQKLSKQTGAPPIESQRPQHVIIEVLEFLGQQPPADLSNNHVDEVLSWAVQNWNLAKVPTSDKRQP